MRVHAQNTETSHARNSDTLLTSQRGADVITVITAKSKQPTGFGAQAGCWVVTRFLVDGITYRSCTGHN